MFAAQQQACNMSPVGQALAQLQTRAGPSISYAHTSHLDTRTRAPRMCSERRVYCQAQPKPVYTRHIHKHTTISGCANMPHAGEGETESCRPPHVAPLFWHLSQPAFFQTLGAQASECKEPKKTPGSRHSSPSLPVRASGWRNKDNWLHELSN